MFWIGFAVGFIGGVCALIVISCAIVSGGKK